MQTAILLASSSPYAVARWESGLQSFTLVLAVRSVDALSEGLDRVTPQLLLLDLDLPGLDGPKGVARLRKSHPATRIIALTGAVSDDVELALFKTGVRGCCRKDVEPQLIGRVVAAVQQGELWIRRTLIPRLLDELSALPYGQTRTPGGAVGFLAELTPREREIAELIGNGENNKQIARHLLITERTVKAHLTCIFRKVGVDGRLSLALRLSARAEADGEYVN